MERIQPICVRLIHLKQVARSRHARCAMATHPVGARCLNATA
eukprot:COSAG06_NODE_28367_length_575_cov_5.495798_1_plen_41_part_10